MEILRTGPLGDGREFAIQVGQLDDGRWAARFMCISRSPVLRVTNSVEELRDWTAGLSAEQIGYFAQAYCG